MLTILHIRKFMMKRDEPVAIAAPIIPKIGIKMMFSTTFVKHDQKRPARLARSLSAIVNIVIARPKAEPLKYAAAKIRSVV